MRLGNCLGFVAAFLACSVAGRASAAPAPLYLTPGPWARYVLPRSGLLVRSNTALRLARPDARGVFTVTGSVSGPHAGTAQLSDDGRALMFKPAMPFTPGETVHVTLAPGVETEAGEEFASKSYSFEVADPRVVRRPDAARSALEELADQPGRLPVPRPQGQKVPGPAPASALSLPADYPNYTITNNTTKSRGFIFLSNLQFYPDNTPPYLLILYSDGTPYFYRRMPANCYDFKPQPNGLLTYYDGSRDRYYAMDSTYTVVDSFQCGNGYSTDLHELRVLPNGHALLLSGIQIVTDMRPYVAGGDSAALVWHAIIQELDTNKNVVFQWASWDHFNILDARGVDFTAHVIDFVHANALDMDTDGNILLSSRHLDEISKINHTTGGFVWRLGGNNNQFTFLNDPDGFSHQHAIRHLANGNLTLFDNGNGHIPQYSRGVEYHLDNVHMTATLVWQYRATPDIYGYAMGYTERLPNGNTLISWGATDPAITEVTPSGTVVYQLDMGPTTFNYRAFREVWPSRLVAATPTGPASRTRLDRVAPNLVRRHATVSMVMGRNAIASLAVFDVSGRMVQTIVGGRVLSAGEHRFDVDGTKLGSGVYFCRLSADGVTSVRRMVVLR